MPKRKKTLMGATKQISTIKKQIKQNIVDLKKYSVMTEKDTLYFDSKAAQKKEVKSLVDKNEELALKYLEIKLKIDQANANTLVEMSDGKNYSISQLLAIKRELEKLIMATFDALNAPKGKKGKIIRFYSETEKRKKVKKWTELFSEIDENLDEINANTTLE
jgi:hypothetical protein